jgi:hypothetical protein
MARTAAEYVEMAEAGIVDLLRQDHAVLWSEAQARISDTRWPSLPAPVQPHHMTTARKALLARKRIVESAETTHGGHRVGVLHLRDTQGIKTQISRAASRKRALFATYLSWLTPHSGYPLGFVGSAGERVAHASMVAAAPHGLRLERPEGGDVAHLLGEEVQGGPLDGAIWLQVTNAVGLPVANVLCPVEVKNIRHWIYPSADELHQLLHKSAHLQIRHPDLLICPILITRRKSFTANAMSRELGFRILDVRKQFVLPITDVDLDVLARLQSELGFVDLVAQDGSDSGLVAALDSVAKTAVQNAMNWKTYAPELIAHFAALREEQTQAAAHVSMEEFREAVIELGGEARW